MGFTILSDFENPNGSSASDKTVVGKSHGNSHIIFNTIMRKKE
jgi:hypothetical protein